MLRTTAVRYAELEAHLLAEHPWDNPEISAVPLAAGSPSYLAWRLTTSTAKPFDHGACRRLAAMRLQAVYDPAGAGVRPDGADSRRQADGPVGHLGCPLDLSGVEIGVREPGQVQRLVTRMGVVVAGERCLQRRRGPERPVQFGRPASGSIRTGTSRSFGRRARSWNASWGLVATAGIDKTARPGPTRAELGKAERHAWSRPPRELLWGTVSRCAATTCSGDEFLAAL